MDKVLIIAEIGVNHNGDLEIAKQLIDAAADAGVDAVKFQTFKADKLVCAHAQKADYQKQTTLRDESQYDMIKKLELTEEDHFTLKNYCSQKHTMFLSSAFDLDSIDLLQKLKIPLFKIPSGEITNYPYLRKIGSLRKRVILSTGMSMLEEVEKAVEVLRTEGTQDIILLHCNTEYPTPMEDVNLKAMLYMKEKMQLEVGYSDHTEGIEVPIAAVALGAKVIEKHFTFDKTMVGPDHRASLEPNELRQMVKAIRNIETALGSGNKTLSASEKKNIEVARKSIVAAVDIKKGERFTEDNLTVKRPGSGISPMRWNEIIGAVANKSYERDELITL